ncbi:MAG: nucleotidyltransferase domain-containing protein [Methylophaga sp.]|nr:nucleotidyltransferase domain-containing protein [Methylophaga sp.]
MISQSGLSDEVITQLVETLKHSPVQEIVLFGSRATGKFRDGSDIDICIDAPGLSVDGLLDLKVKLDALDLPWMIDLVHKQTIDNPALLEHIQNYGVRLGQELH